jgi:acyl-CoA thioesterase I
MTGEYKQILVLGDSVARGVIYDEQRNRYALTHDNCTQIVQGSISASITNLSRFGQTLPAAAERLTKALNDGYKPELAVLELGGNDCDFNWEAVARDPDKPHTPATHFDVFKETLAKMIAELKDRLIRPVLLTLHPIDADRYFKWFTRGNPAKADSVLRWLKNISRIYWYQERYSEAVREAAEKYDTPVINTRGAFLNEEDFRQYLCADGIHPNVSGHRLMADKILDFIRERAQGLLIPEAATGHFAKA